MNPKMIKKPSKKSCNITTITPKTRNFITAHIEQMVDLPIAEYDEPENTDPFILNTLLFISQYLLFLVPVLYFLTYHNGQQVTCNDYTNANGIFFNNKTKKFDLYCKSGNQAKFTAKSLYGLFSKEKRCIPMPKNYKQKYLYKSLLASKKILTDKAVDVKIAYSQLDSIAKDLLHKSFNEKHITHPEKFKLKKINKYYMKIAKGNDRLQTRKFRYSNKKSIFYKKSLKN